MRKANKEETVFIPVDAGDGAPEFRHDILFTKLSDAPLALEIEADETTREGLARRFDLLSLEKLAGQVELRRKGSEVRLSGHLLARYSQRCVVTGKPVKSQIEEPLELVFVRENDTAAFAPDEEVELSGEDLDTLTHDGRIIDLGEALAQSLGLALDPFPRAKNAAEIAAKEGFTSEEEAVAAENASKQSPFAGLSSLKDKLEGKP